MSEEEIASILRSIQATLRRIEARQEAMDEGRKTTKLELEIEGQAQPELGISEIIHERTGH